MKNGEDGNMLFYINGINVVQLKNGNTHFFMREAHYMCHVKDEIVGISNPDNLVLHCKYGSYIIGPNPTFHELELIWINKKESWVRFFYQHIGIQYSNITGIEEKRVDSPDLIIHEGVAYYGSYVYRFPEMIKPARTQ